MPYINRSSEVLRSVIEGTHGRLIRFLGRVAFFFLAWKMSFFVIWRSPTLLELYNDFSLRVIDRILMSTSLLLDALGFNIEVISAERLVKIAGTVGVTVGEPCIGFELMAVYSGLVCSSFFSGNKVRLLCYILGGLAMINLVNICRIALLAYLVQFDPYLWEINHKYVFTLVIYTLIFGLWASYVAREKRTIHS